jgi:hypothetical protein
MFLVIPMEDMNLEKSPETLDVPSLRLRTLPGGVLNHSWVLKLIQFDVILRWMKMPQTNIETFSMEWETMKRIPYLLSQTPKRGRHVR